MEDDALPVHHLDGAHSSGSFAVAITPFFACLLKPCTSYMSARWPWRHWSVKGSITDRHPA